MPFRVVTTFVADRQLRSMSVRDRDTLRAAIQARLTQQPTTVTRAVKRLRPNPTVTYELRVGDPRVLSDVEGSDVVVKIVGAKLGNELIVEGEAFDGLRDDPPQSVGDPPADDA